MNWTTTPAQDEFCAELCEVTGLPWAIVPTGGGCTAVEVETAEWSAQVSNNAEAPTRGEFLDVVFRVLPSATNWADFAGGLHPCEEVRTAESVRGVMVALADCCREFRVMYPSAWL